MAIIRKCPSCGAPLQAEPWKNVAICEYCGGRILLSEAYSEKSTPQKGKINSDLVAAERAFENKKYGEAFSLYTEALKSMPTNDKVRLKIEICKAETHKFIDYTLSPLLEQLRNTAESGIDISDDLVADILKTVQSAYSSTISFYNKQQVTLAELQQIHTKLASCIELCSELLKYDSYYEKEIKAISVALVNSVLASKVYVSGKVQGGGVLTKPYHIDEQVSRSLSELRNDYEADDDVNKLVPTYEENVRYSEDNYSAYKKGSEIVWLPKAVIAGFLILCMLLALLRAL